MQRRSFLRSLATGAAVAPVLAAGPALLTCQSGPTKPPMPPSAAVEHHVVTIYQTFDLRGGADPDRVIAAFSTPIKPINRLRRAPLFPAGM